MFSFFKKKKKEVVKFTPSLPLTWWIDDLSHRVCALQDDPVHGLAKLPWPDCEKVYLAVDKDAYDRVVRKCTILKELLLLCHPSVAGMRVGELQCTQWQAFITEFPEENQ